MEFVQDENGRYLPKDGPVHPDTIRRAPPGQFRVVTEDPSDAYWPFDPTDCQDLPAVRACLRSRNALIYSPCHVVFDDQCKRVNLYN